MAVTITGSVGFGGRNNPGDISKIQLLLNKRIEPPIIVTDMCTGKIDDPTVIAIKKFQSTYSGSPDGRVDVGGTTLRKLNAEPFSQLPQVLGNFGYYLYGDNFSDKQWGTADTIGTLIEICTQFRIQNPTTLVGIGNISYQSGAKMPPHESHRDGRNVDIRPCRKDESLVGVQYTDTTAYDQEKTKQLIKMFLAHKNVQYILFNDPVIISELKGVQWYKGHHDHFHIQMKA